MAVKFKLASAAKRVKTGFEPYDGPEISRAGVYRAILKKLKYEKKSSNNYGFNIVFELEAAPGDPKGHSIYDGAPMFSRTIVTQMADGSALKEGAQNNLDNFLNAIGVKANPDVICEDGDVDERPIVVKKIGGKAPEGIAVNLEIRIVKYEGEPRAEIGSIFAVGDEKTSSKKALPKQIDDEEDDDESDLLDMDSATEEGEEEQTREEREEELGDLSLADLKKFATEEYDLDIKGLKKAGILDAILDYEFSEEDEEEDEEDEEDPEEEEVDEEEEDDEEEEEEDDEDVRREELSKLNRAQLKKVLKELDSSFKVTTKMTDKKIVEKIIELEFEIPF